MHAVIIFSFSIKPFAVSLDNSDIFIMIICLVSGFFKLISPLA